MKWRIVDFCGGARPGKFWADVDQKLTKKSRISDNHATAVTTVIDVYEIDPNTLSARYIKSYYQDSRRPLRPKEKNSFA